MRTLSVVPRIPAFRNHSVPNVKKGNQPVARSSSAMTSHLLEPDSRATSSWSPSGVPGFTTGARLLRTAQCLTALLQSPTASAGLNEARYNVLDALRRSGAETCSQTEL